MIQLEYLYKGKILKRGKSLGMVFSGLLRLLIVLLEVAVQQGLLQIGGESHFE